MSNTKTRKTHQKKNSINNSIDINNDIEINKIKKKQL